MDDHLPIANDLLRCIGAEFAAQQMPEADLAWLADERSNSVAMLMKHVGGNLRSRFTDF